MMNLSLVKSRKAKRAVSLLLVFALLSCLSIAAGAEYTEYCTSGDYEYCVQEDGTVKITHYSGYEETVSVPESIDGRTVTVIGSQAFTMRSEMKHLVFPETVEVLESIAVAGCSVLESVHIPDGLSRMEGNPFVSCYGLTSIELSIENPYFAKIGEVLFSKSDKRLVCYPAGLTEETYEIPQGISVISSYAFSGCKSLKTVVIPDSVTTIGDAAFMYCAGLSSISIPDSVTSVGANPFCLCQSLETISVSPDQPYLATIDKALFSKPDKRLITYPYALQAERYDIPDGIKIVGDRAFDSCDKLVEVSFPSSLEEIGLRSFYGTSELQYAVIPDSVTSIGTMAFYDSGVNQVKLPSRLQYLGASAFGQCWDLTGIDIPDSLMKVDTNPFSNCISLTEIRVSEHNSGLKAEDGVLFSKDGKTLICYPGTLPYENYAVPYGTVEIGSFAFTNCVLLHNVDIPDTVESIGDYAFNVVDIREITIPPSVVHIGQYAFKAFGDVLFTVTRNSYAAQYCISHGLSYTYTDANDWLTP